VLLVAAVALTVVLRAGPDTPAATQPSAEEEVEALLAATANKSPPAEVALVVDGPDPKVYRLEEATVRLDGAPMVFSFAAPSGSPPKGTAVSDGDHVVSARLVYRGRPIGPYPWDEGVRWALPARVMLKASRGLRLTIRLTVEANERAMLASQRLGLRSEVEPEMLATVDDAPLPPPPLPKLPPPAELAPVAASSSPPATEFAAKPPTAAPAKKRKQKVARSKSASAIVPAPAATGGSAALPPAADALEEATARLRSALASPRDGGVAPGGEAPH
jgi:hypothetical protein